MRATVGLVVAIVVASGTLAPTSAVAEEDYFTGQKRAPLTYRVDGDRTRDQRLVLASLAGATLIAAGVGVIFHLRSRDATAEVEAFSGEHTNLIYTPYLDGRRDDAERQGTIASVSYSVAGAFLIGTVVTFIVTSPPDRIVEYGTEGKASERSAWLVPIEGGVLGGASWSY